MVLEIDDGFTRTHLEERSHVPAVGEQVGRPAGVRPNPHLCVRLVDVHLERCIVRGLEGGHHALFTGLTPCIFLVAEKKVSSIFLAANACMDVSWGGLLAFCCW